MEARTGSFSYGTSTDSSDIDIVGVVVPPRSIVFPYRNDARISGFGEKPPAFDQWIHAASTGDGPVDATYYSVVKLFQLCAENNPNMLDVLFVPENCISHITLAGRLIRDNRGLFVSKRAWHKFRGYAFSQIHKLQTKSHEPDSKRNAIIKEYGYDVKFATHCVRLLLECEQLLLSGSMDLQRDSEFLRSVRTGKRTQEWVERWFSDKSTELEKLYVSSSIPYGPNESDLLALLKQVLAVSYGEEPSRTSEEIERLLGELEEQAQRVVATTTSLSIATKGGSRWTA